MKKRVGLLVMAYGTPRTEAEILPYYTHIRHGYPPTADEIKVLTERYRAIGGVSPLAAITERQAAELLRQLNENAVDCEYKLYIGNKHTSPFLEDAVTAMADDGITEAVAIVMAPYFSLFATEAYFERARRRAGRYGMTIKTVEAWHEEPGFRDYWRKALVETLAKTKGDDHVKVIFTAHSLPYHVIHMGDTYPEAVQATAAAIAKEAGIDTYELAWQSAGVRGDWLTPDVLTVTREQGKPGDTMVYVPIGFVCDHLEVLYDNDIACKALCDELNLTYLRVPMPNTDTVFIGAMRRAVEEVAL